MYTVFMVEDDPNIRMLTGMHLQLAGYAVRELEEHGFASILAGRESLSQGDFTLAELRLFQPDTAFRLLREIPVSRRALLTEVLTAHLPTDLSPAPGAYLHALDLGLKLGYIPRDRNKIFARLMDAGKDLYGTVRHKEIVGGYYRIVIKVFLHD